MRCNFGVKLNYYCDFGEIMLQLHLIEEALYDL